MRASRLWTSKALQNVNRSKYTYLIGSVDNYTLMCQYNYCVAETTKGKMSLPLKPQPTTMLQKKQAIHAR